MDLEHLTKHQIILLTLLVSFVTSIATGIVTVSLMNQAPPSVTRTINQIIEKTVQSVTPAPNVAAVSTQKTIVVKDDDLIAQSVAAVQKSIIRITAKGDDELIARGIIIDKSGVAVTDYRALEDSGAEEFEAILHDGHRAPLLLRASVSTTTPFRVVTIVSTSTTFVPSLLADTSKLRLGQSILRIAGGGVDSVAEGVIAMLPKEGGIVASVQSTTPGSVLVTRFGEVLALTTSRSLAQSSDLYTIVTPALVQIKPIETKPVPKP